MKTLIGMMEGFSGEKTVKVQVTTLVKHKRYHKIVKNKKSFLCHCEIEGLAIGDSVNIGECKPISKRKSWRVIGAAVAK